MPVPFSFPVPITRAEGTPWPATVPMFASLAAGNGGAETIVVIDDVELHVTNIDGHWDGFATRDGQRIDAPWPAEDLITMVARVSALVDDMRALGDNITAITDDAASAYGLGLGTNPTPTTPHVKVRTQMPDINDVANWPGVLPHPDRFAWDAERNAVVIEASFRTFVVQGEIVTEKGHLVALDDESRATVANWVNTFTLARGRVQTFLHFHIESLVRTWVKQWNEQKEMAAI